MYFYYMKSKKNTKIIENLDSVQPETYFFTNTTGIISYFIILIIVLGIYAAYHKQYPSDKPD